MTDNSITLTLEEYGDIQNQLLTLKYDKIKLSDKIKKIEAENRDSSSSKKDAKLTLQLDVEDISSFNQNILSSYIQDETVIDNFNKDLINYLNSVTSIQQKNTDTPTVNNKTINSEISEKELNMLRYDNKKQLNSIANLKNKIDELLNFEIKQNELVKSNESKEIEYKKLVESLNSKISELSRKNENLNVQLSDNLYDDTRDLVNKNNQLENKIIQLENQYKIVYSDNHTLKTQKNEMEIKLSELQDNYALLKEEKNSLIIKMQALIQEHQSQFEKLNSEQQVNLRQQKDLNILLTETKQNLASVQEKNKSLTSVVKPMEMKIKELDEKLFICNDEREKFKKMFENESWKNQRLDQQIKTQKPEQLAKPGFLGSLWNGSNKTNKNDQMLETMSTQIEELNAEVSILKEDLSNATSNLTQQRDRCKNYEIALLSVSSRFMNVENIKDIEKNDELKQMILEFKQGGIENLTNLFYSIYKENEVLKSEIHKMQADK